MTTTTQKKTTTKPRTVAAKQPAVIEELPVNPFSFEVLNLVSKQRSNVKKVEVLKKYDHSSLKALFIWNFDESIVSILLLSYLTLQLVFRCKVCYMLG